MNLRRTALAWLGVLLIAIGILVLAPIGRGVLFTTHQPYDDEGYVAWTLLQFAQGIPLYTEVFTQYGPLPYVLGWLQFNLGADFTTEAIRWTTLALWLGACAALAGLAWRVGGRMVWAPASLVVSFLTLSLGTNEPIHPGHLLAAILAVGTLAVVLLAERRRPGWAAGAAGAMVAALALTKINVGAFAGMSLVTLLVAGATTGRLRRWLLPAWTAVAVVAPFALVAGQIRSPEFLRLALYAAAGQLAFAAVLRRHPEGLAGLDLRHLLHAAIGGLTVTIPVLGIVILRGTSPADLLEGMLLGPLRMPGVYRYAMPASPLWDVVALLVVVAAGVLLRGGAAAATLESHWIPAVRVCAAVALAAAQFATDPSFEILAGVSLLAWTAAGPGVGSVPASTILASFAALQVLHAYPVMGSQRVWAVALALPLAWRAATGITHALSRSRPGRAVPVALGVAAVLALPGANALVTLAHRNDVRSAAGVALGFPGTRGLLLRMPQALRWRVVGANLTAQEGPVLTLPGMGSLLRWTGRRPPTPAFATHWWSLLPAPHQQKLIEALERNPGIPLVVDRRHLDMLASDGFALSGPALEWIARHYEPAWAIDAYEVHYRRGYAAPPPVWVAATKDGMAEVSLPALPGRRLAGIQLIDAFYPLTPRAIIAWPRLTILRVDSGSDLPVTLPLSLDAPVRLRFPMQIPDQDLPEPLALSFIGTGGTHLGEALFEVPARPLSIP